MILIYIDSQILEREWIPLLTFADDYMVCCSFVEFQESTADIKIAFTTHRLHCDHDIDCDVYQGFEDKINKLSQISHLVFSLESELHHFHWEIWERCHNDNVYWVLPGNVNDNQDMRDHIIYWGDWFKTTSMLYKDLPHKLAEIDPYAIKPKLFDALLGSPKPHRDFVYNSVMENNLQDKFIIPYGGKWDDDKFYAEDYFIWEPECVPVDKTFPGTANAVRYHGVWTGLSRVIPITVFNDCAYSIIAETDHDNTLSFFSEKTAKPLIARRLFIAFTGYKFLQNLRDCGFKTFDGVIDESYDLIIDDEKRYTEAFEQVKYLCTLDQADVYKQIKHIVEHNRNHIMTTDWTRYAADRINQVIFEKLG
jgi:hypothetical protein